MQARKHQKTSRKLARLFLLPILTALIAPRIKICPVPSIIYQNPYKFDCRPFYDVKRLNAVDSEKKIVESEKGTFPPQYNHIAA